MNSSPGMREQFAAISLLRWQVFTHSLRNLRGRMELASRIIMMFGYAVVGLGGTIALGILSWYLISHDALAWFALPLWLLFLYWQLFPVMATAFTENFDASNFLRFPLSYRSYFLIRLAYGALDPTSVIGAVWLIGMAVGIGVSAPMLFPWAALVLACFGAFNILLNRAIFAWLDRWLARRKSREILGVVFILFVIGIQFVGNATGYFLRRYGNHRRPELAGAALKVLAVSRVLPPGLAATALSAVEQGESAVALGAFALLCAYSGAAWAFLHLRIRAQFRGENLSEAAPSVARGKQEVRVGWSAPGISGPVAAVVEKELRYLSRSGPMLFPLIMPVMILVILRFGAANTGRGANLFMRHIDFAFPIGMAYALLILGNFTYNSFGTDAAGVQFFFMSPVRFREILLGKNLAQGVILAAEVLFVWIGVAVIFRPPGLRITLTTLAGVLFAAMVNCIAGNLLSLYSPKRFDFASFGRQRASGITALASIGVFAVVFGLVGFAVVLAAYFGKSWLSTLILLALAAGAWRGYVFLLARIDRLATGRRETLIAELCRAA